MFGVTIYALVTAPEIEDTLLDETKCLKCGKDVPHYCEACHQIVLAENIKLQVEIEKMKGEQECKN